MEKMCLVSEEVVFELCVEQSRYFWQAVGHVGLKLGCNQEIEGDFSYLLSDVPWTKFRGGKKKESLIYLYGMSGRLCIHI